MGKKVKDGHSEVVIGIHQTGRTGDNAVPVIVGIVAKGDIETIFQRDEIRHGIGRRTTHTNLAVPVERHETERRIDGGIY